MTGDLAFRWNEVICLPEGLDGGHARCGVGDAPNNSVRKTATRAIWIATVTHLHEHLGQLIACARSNNNVTPPWSK